jgi:8-oxo-dGTP pyrophosphatase MutT (NUDIX family)
MISVDEVAGIIQSFEIRDDGEAAKSKDLTLSLLHHVGNPFSRNHFTPGHITATGVVLNPSRNRVLLVHHKRLQRWLMPGGHVEPMDQKISDTARREVLEETGVKLSTAALTELVGLDVHPIPPRRSEPLHLHHDLIFYFRAENEIFECSEESNALIWCGLDEFARYELPGSIRRSIRRALESEV